MNQKTKNTALAAMLTAISMIITFSPFKLMIPPFTLTIGVHVPTIIAMLINPYVTIMTIIGSCLGFLMVIPYPSSIIVALRAATHIVFALVGYTMFKKRSVNLGITAVVTGLIHAACEAVVVFALTPLLLPDSETSLITLTAITFFGTLIHHAIDFAISVPVAMGLNRAKIIKLKG